MKTGATLHDADARAPRESGGELVRIIAMTMIVIWHYLLHGGVCFYYNEMSYLLPLFVGGVDLFVMISGYYLINVRWRSVVKLLLCVWVFDFVSIASVNLCGLGEPVGGMEIVSAVFAPFSRSRYWFVAIYFGLIALSPILRACPITNVKTRGCVFLR